MNEFEIAATERTQYFINLYRKALLPKLVEKQSVFVKEFFKNFVNIVKPALYDEFARKYKNRVEVLKGAKPKPFQEGIRVDFTPSPGTALYHSVLGRQDTLFKDNELDDTMHFVRTSPELYFWLYVVNCKYKEMYKNDIRPYNMGKLCEFVLREYTTNSLSIFSTQKMYDEYRQYEKEFNDVVFKAYDVVMNENYTIEDLDEIFKYKGKFKS